MNPQSLIFIVLIGAAAWMLFIRPQKRRQLAQRELLDKIQPGAEVLTAAGLYGTVVEADGEEVKVEIADGVVVKIARRAIGAVIPPEVEEAEEAEEDDDAAEPEAETPAADAEGTEAGPEPPS